MGRSKKFSECGEPQSDPVAMERIPGGAGHSHDPGDFDQVQLMKGIHHEMEHGPDVVTAMEIAMDHLSEDPAYYDNPCGGEEMQGPPERPPMPSMQEVYVYPQQAHLDDGDLDPLDTGVAQPKRNIRFAGSGPKVGNIGV